MNAQKKTKPPVDEITIPLASPPLEDILGMQNPSATPKEGAEGDPTGPFQVTISKEVKAEFKALCAAKGWTLFERVEYLMRQDIGKYKGEAINAESEALT